MCWLIAGRADFVPFTEWAVRNQMRQNGPLRSLVLLRKPSAWGSGPVLTYRGLTGRVSGIMEIQQI